MPQKNVIPSKYLTSLLSSITITNHNTVPLRFVWRGNRLSMCHCRTYSRLVTISVWKIFSRFSILDNNNNYCCFFLFLWLSYFIFYVFFYLQIVWSVVLLFVYAFFKTKTENEKRTRAQKLADPDFLFKHIARSHCFSPVPVV